VFTLQLANTRSGALTALWMNTVNKRSWSSEGGARTGDKIAIDFFGEGGRMTAQFNSAFNTLSVIWTRKNGRGIPATLTRAGGAPTLEPVANESTPSNALLVYGVDEISHAVEFQTVDRLNSARLFTVFEPNTVEDIASTESPYDLGDATTVAEFTKAGLRYVLLTTIETFECSAAVLATRTQSQEKATLSKQVIEQRQIKVRKQTGRNKAQIRAEQRRIRLQAATAEINRLHISPQNVKQQTVRLTLRCRLFDLERQAWLVSSSFTYATNRQRTVAAQPNNDASTGDLIDQAARAAADWVLTRTTEAIQPITVVERNGTEILINRGPASGLEKGKVFEVVTTGKRIKAPTTAVSTGLEETTVGRVIITELHPEFSKARIVQDKGIVVGAILRALMP
jgi:hypothetical protein